MGWGGDVELYLGCHLEMIGWGGSWMGKGLGMLKGVRWGKYVELYLRGHVGDGRHVVAGLYKQNTVLLKPEVSQPHPHHLMVLENKTMSS